MPKGTNNKLDFGQLGCRAIEARFDGGDLSFGTGVQLLRCMDQRLGLCASAAIALGDKRKRRKVRHSLARLVGGAPQGASCGRYLRALKAPKRISSARR